MMSGSEGNRVMPTGTSMSLWFQRIFLLNTIAGKQADHDSIKYGSQVAAIKAARSVSNPMLPNGSCWRNEKNLRLQYTIKRLQPL